MKACRCGNCGQVIPGESLLVVAAPEDACFTLEEDEPVEWMCPLCFQIEVAAAWVTFYLPGTPKLIEPVATVAKSVQGELF